MDRRHFLKSSTFFTIAAATGTLTACGSDNKPSSGSDNPSSDAGKPPAGTFAFAQGVASGDPRADSVVFWTRAIASAGGTAPVAVQLQISPTSDFAALAANVALQAVSDHDFTVRAKVTGLKSGSTYFYRFIAGSDVSATGTAKTAPAADAANDKVRFAWFTCQDWTVNHWQAMSLIAAETDLDFVVHVGDYIYETVDASFQAGAAEPAHGALKLPNGQPLPGGVGQYASTVDDYRTLYRTYRTDSRLQAIHQKFAMIPIWDDHEFSDDCWQDHQTYTNENTQQTARRRSATQAWAEYMPIDWSDVKFDATNPSFANISIYRDFHYGKLVHLVMTDERMFRDDHVVSEAAVAQAQGHDPINGSDSVGARYFVQKPVLAQFDAIDTAAMGRAPSILGTEQTAWFKNTMSSSTATWRVWGNEVTLNRMQVDLTSMAQPPYNAVYMVNCDGWDGYPTHKQEILGYLKNNNVSNVVAITGDLHAFQCGVVTDPATSVPVLVDFVTAGISSTSFYNYLKAGAQGTPLAPLVLTPTVFDGVLQGNNPDFKYVDHDAQGYASATVTAGAFSVVFTKVKPLNSDGTPPADPLLKRTRLTVASGTKTVVVEQL
ncbi:alkaline phosphatase D family protein [Paraburkholderia rhizosphaerae]|uniref:Alkaline phosphatase D n=1 Tax=Paraburkholderia rhizosphaerae TaxID=480658 RepID=A0A4R8LVJ5_9BURK|nr:alkaline phosphatase D family protein [Paraburkholderia rhizosphaerae]TDY51608.1 alkaline phosphatase D [Paraburkholderia rhizosphaerae]